jgi:hypothetical protein
VRKDLELTDFHFYGNISLNIRAGDSMFGPSQFQNQTVYQTNRQSGSGWSRLSQNEFFFGYFYFAYACASGRCFMPGRSSRK